MVSAGKFGGLQEESARQPLKLLFPKNFLGLPNKRDAKRNVEENGFGILIDHHLKICLYHLLSM